MLSAAEREAIERLTRVARGEQEHEWFDDRSEDDPADWDPPAPIPQWASAEADAILARSAETAPKRSTVTAREVEALAPLLRKKN